MWIIVTEEEQERARKVHEEQFRKAMIEPPYPNYPIWPTPLPQRIPGAWPTPRPINHVELTRIELIAVELVKSGDAPEAAADKAKRIVKALGD